MKISTGKSINKSASQRFQYRELQKELLQMEVNISKKNLARGSRKLVKKPVYGAAKDRIIT